MAIRLRRNSTPRSAILPDPAAGIAELRWFESHVEQLEAYAGTYVAILGESVAASAPNIRAVHDELLARGINDALIVRVPTGAEREQYLIA